MEPNTPREIPVNARIMRFEGESETDDLILTLGSMDETKSVQDVRDEYLHKCYRHCFIAVAQPALLVVGDVIKIGDEFEFQVAQGPRWFYVNVVTEFDALHALLSKCLIDNATSNEEAEDAFRLLFHSGINYIDIVEKAAQIYWTNSNDPTWMVAHQDLMHYLHHVHKHDSLEGKMASNVLGYFEGDNPLESTFVSPILNALNDEIKAAETNHDCPHIPLAGSGFAGDPPQGLKHGPNTRISFLNRNEFIETQLVAGDYTHIYIYAPDLDVVRFFAWINASRLQRPRTVIVMFSVYKEVQFIDMEHCDQFTTEISARLGLAAARTGLTTITQNLHH